MLKTTTASLLLVIALAVPVISLTPITDGLISYWPLDDDAFDHWGDNDGVAFGGATNVTGVIDGAYTFDGDGDYINVSDDPSLNPTDAITVSAWIKADTWASSRWEGTIVGKDTLAPDSVGYVLRTGDSGTLSFTVGTSPGWPEAFSDPVMSEDTWYHVVGTYNDTTIVVYINGVERDLDSNGGLWPINSSPSDLLIGLSPYINENRIFNGTIDEVMIFNRSLSAEEVKQLYNLNSPVIDSVILNATSTDNLTSDNLTGYVTAHDDEDDNITYAYNWYKDGSLDSTTLITDGLVAYWPLNNDTLDYWGGNDGTGMNGASRISGGKVGGAYSFDGISGYINVSNDADLNITGNLTIAAWIYPINSSDGDVPIVGKIYDIDEGSDTGGYQIRWKDTQWEINIANDQWGYVYRLNSVQLNTWQYVVGTYDGSTIKLYVNGVLQTPDDTQSPPSSIKGISQPFGIGHIEDSGLFDSDYFEGSVDEVMVFNRALSADEIEQLYYGSAWGGSVLNSSRLAGPNSDWILGVLAADYLGWGNETNSTQLELTCPVALTNTSSNWQSITECRANSTKLQQRQTTQYDENYCGEVENVTFYENRSVSCFYCGEDGCSQWVNAYAHSEDDEAEAIVNTDDGGYAIAGKTYDYDDDNDDVFLLKIDADGNEEWDKTFDYNGDSQNDYAYALIQTSDGGYAVGGYVYSYDTDSDDPWIIKINSTGDEEWNKTFDYKGAHNHGYAYSIVQAPDDGYAVAGRTYNDETSSYDVWVLKINSTGGEEWNKTFDYKGQNTQDYGRAIVNTQDGGYAVGGYVYSYDTDSDDPWIIKINSTGDEEWNQTYDYMGEGYDEEGYALIQTSDGGYAIAGELYYYLEEADSWNDDFLIVKTNSTGGEEWSEHYGGIDDDTAYSLVQTSDDGYALAGSTGSYGAGSDDYWLVKIDGNGNVEWNQTYGGYSNDDASSLVRAPDDGYAIAGYTDSYSLDDDDIFWVVKTGEDGKIDAPLDYSYWSCMNVITSEDDPVDLTPEEIESSCEEMALYPYLANSDSLYQSLDEIIDDDTYEITAYRIDTSDRSEVTFTWEGYSTANDGGTGLSLYVYNYTDFSWSEFDSTDELTEQLFTETFVDLSDISQDDVMWIMIASHGTYLASCPFLYLQDNSGYSYYTDLAGEPLGVPWFKPQKYESGVYELGDFQPVDGVYKMKVREVIQESDYFDEAKLVLVDVPEGYSVLNTWSYTYPLNQAPSKEFMTVKDPITPLTATDDYGNDVLAEVSEKDGHPVAIYDETQNPITLDFGDIENPEYAKLIITGWGAYEANANRTTQNSLLVQTRDERGSWVTQKSFGGFIGDSRTIVFDISDILDSDNTEMRIVAPSSPSTLHLIDQVLLDDSAPVDFSVTYVDPSVADLRFGGSTNYAYATTEHRHVNVTDERLPAIRTHLMYGNFTRYGDVRPLLESADDMFVVMRHGDELALEFQDMPLEGGKTRKVFLLADVMYTIKYSIYGFVRDTIDPVPFHGMSKYPYTSPESYPNDAEHQEYLSEYNTRKFMAGNDSEHHTTYVNWVALHTPPNVSVEMGYPDSNLAVTEGQTYEFTVDVSCTGYDCGDVDVGLEGVDQDTSIFSLSGDLTLENATCLFNYDNDDMDSVILWTDLTGKIKDDNGEETSSDTWFTWLRNGTENMTEDYLPDRPEGIGDYARPVPLPASDKTVWFDWENRQIVWDGGDASFDDVGIDGDGGMDDYYNYFYFITDGINKIHAGADSTGIARLLEFNFDSNTVAGGSAVVFAPGDWWYTEEDAFGHVLFTVNGQVMYYLGSGVFRIGGNLNDPNGVTADYTVTQWADPDQPGLDFFTRVDDDGYLWFGDWGHDNGGYFDCGDDEYLGVGKTNIVYDVTTEDELHQLSFTVDGDNPAVISLEEGESAVVTFEVTFSGDLDDYREMYAYAQILNVSGFGEAETDTFNVTLGEAEEEEEQQEEDTGGGAVTWATYAPPTGGQQGGGTSSETGGQPTIEMPSGVTVGEGVQIVITNSDGTPAGGTAKIITPDGTVITVQLVGGRAVFTPDQPGEWVITYTDSNGKTVTKTINVAGAPEELGTPVEQQLPAEQLKKPIQAGFPWMLAVIAALIVAIVIVLAIRMRPTKKRRK